MIQRLSSRSDPPQTGEDKRRGRPAEQPSYTCNDMPPPRRHRAAYRQESGTAKLLPAQQSWKRDSTPISPEMANVRQPTRDPDESPTDSESWVAGVTRASPGQL